MRTITASGRDKRSLKDSVILVAKLFSWTTIRHDCADSPNTPTSREVSPELAHLTRAAICDSNEAFLRARLAQLETLRLHRDASEISSSSGEPGCVWGKYYEELSEGYDRPLLVLHFSGYWSILADVKFRPSADVLRMLDRLGEEVFWKWREALPHSLPKVSHWIKSDLNFRSWAPVCFVNAMGYCTPGSSGLLRRHSLERLRPIADSVSTVETLIQCVQPDFEGIVNAQRTSWSVAINTRVESALVEIFTMLASAVEGGSWTLTQKLAARDCMRMLDESRGLFDAFPDPKSTPQSLNRVIECPFMRCYGLRDLFTRIRQQLIAAGWEDTPLLRSYDKFMRTIWIEVLPISIIRHVAWDHLRVSDIFESFTRIDEKERKLAEFRRRERAARHSRRRTHRSRDDGERRRSEVERESRAGPSSSRGQHSRERSPTQERPKSYSTHSSHDKRLDHYRLTSEAKGFLDSSSSD